MPLAGIYNITIDQGATYILPLVVSSSGGPRDLSGFSARGMIRKSYTAPTPLASFNVSGALDTSGSFSIYLTATQTNTLPSMVGVYDLEIYSGSYVERLIQGNCTVSPQVTK